MRLAHFVVSSLPRFFVFCLVFVLLYIFYYNFNIVTSIANDEINVTVATLHCEALINTARKILDGEKVVLPFNNSGKTLWNFKSRSPKIPNSPQASMNISAKILEESTIKGKTYFITFGHNCCSFSKRRAVEKAKEVGGFDFASAFNMTSLAPQFRQTNSGILSARRGAGHWLWKPYILLKVLIERMSKEDIVLYHDAGAYFIRPAAPLLKLAQRSTTGIVVFSLAKIRVEEHYTKQDAFTLMEMDVTEARATTQRIGGYVVLRKTCDSIQFVMEWLAYLSDRRIATDERNTMGLPNSKSFKAHRHDQSVLSLLSKKWGLYAFRDPSQFGNNATYYGPYEQLIALDRLKSK